MRKDSDLPELVPRVTKIKAGDKKTKKTKVDKVNRKKASPKFKKTKNPKRRNPLRAFGSYIKAAFQEIRLVKWPTRKETWAMTLAVIVYSLIMIGVVLLLDNFYDWLFKLVIGK